ncbi:MAG: hypothetical protein H0V26_07745 [Solirubrobacterales bacterium]|nr:hypothetical protein [Solirubrobacterales bacterium]
MGQPTQPYDDNARLNAEHASILEVPVRGARDSKRRKHHKGPGGATYRRIGAVVPGGHRRADDDDGSQSGIRKRRRISRAPAPDTARFDGASRTGATTVF